MLILDMEENIRFFKNYIYDERPAIAQTSPAAFLLVRVMCSASKGVHRHLHEAVSTAALHKDNANSHPSVNIRVLCLHLSTWLMSSSLLLCLM